MKVLEHEFLGIVKLVESKYPLLREYANGQVPFIIDLLPHHLTSRNAPPEAHRQYKFLMERFGRRYREYCELRKALVEDGVTIRIIPYRVKEGFHLEYGYWQNEYPQIHPTFGTMGGPSLLDEQVHAWAMVQDTFDPGPIKWHKRVLRWMKRSDLVWVVNGGRKRLIFTDVDDKLRCYDTDGTIARLGIIPMDWSTELEERESDEDAGAGAANRASDADGAVTKTASKTNGKSVKKES